MQGKKSKNLISQSNTTGPAALWRTVESSATRQGILFDKASAKNKRISSTDEPKRQHQTIRLLSLYATPMPLAKGRFEKND